MGLHADMMSNMIVTCHSRKDFTMKTDSQPPRHGVTELDHVDLTKLATAAMRISKMMPPGLIAKMLIRLYYSAARQRDILRMEIWDCQMIWCSLDLDVATVSHAKGGRIRGETLRDFKHLSRNVRQKLALDPEYLPSTSQCREMRILVCRLAAHCKPLTSAAYCEPGGACTTDRPDAREPDQIPPF